MFIIKKYKKIICLLVALMCSFSLTTCSVFKLEKMPNKKIITFETEKKSSQLEKVGGTEKNIEKEEVKDKVSDEVEETKEEQELKEQVEQKDNKSSLKENNTSVNERCSKIYNVSLSGKEKYYDFSSIKDGHAILYVTKDNDKKKNYTITINAGHGVKGGSNYKTYSHPDMSPKITGGTNKAGEIMSYAISEGMTFNSGMQEQEANLKVATVLRDALLDFGYNVLMIREDNDSRLDNVARTVLANEHSDMHISIHFDSTDTDSGMFCILPLDDEGYKNMEPVKDIYDDSVFLGKCIVDSFKENGEKVKGNGKRYMDLTQVSYSTIPTIDLELGDRATETSDWRLATFIPSIVYGIEKFYHTYH